MKKCSVLFLFSFMFMSCSKDGTTAPPASNSQASGKVFFKIDKENAPANVVSITAALSRQGFETIIGSLNLISDSTADIVIGDIPIGVWGLKVEARDANNLVVYSGETEVTVIEKMIVQVNLTLVPTSTGKGSIYILVNWGTSPLKWNNQTGNTLSDLQSVYFLDAQTGWAVGGSGVLLNTTDGGISWYQVSSGTKEHLEDVSFINANIGFAVGDHGKILKTTNAGLSRTSEITNSTKWLNSIFFYDTNNAWAVGKRGAILKYKP